MNRTSTSACAEKKMIWPKVALRIQGWVKALCAMLALVLGMQGGLVQAQTVYFHNDTAGSPVAATDASGNLLWKESYRPYGERMLKPAAANTQWFHGKPLDPDTGMEDFGARNYDPVLGRFLSIDPVDFQDKNIHSFNRYNYGNNNPLKYKDPDGRLPVVVLALAALKVADLAMTAYDTYQSYQAGGVGEAAKSLATSAAISAIPGGKALDRGIDAAKVASREAAKGATLKPGPFAKESIPGHMGKPTAAEQKQVNALMEKNGCHTCGTKDPGTKSGNSVVDHQPPQALGETKEFLPHCIDCMRRQGGETLQELINRANK